MGTTGINTLLHLCAFEGRNTNGACTQRINSGGMVSATRTAAGSYTVVMNEAIDPEHAVITATCEDGANPFAVSFGSWSTDRKTFKLFCRQGTTDADPAALYFRIENGEKA